jgi:predicted SAM-dependent methyltransferase
MIKLNLGSGSQPLPDFINLDIKNNNSIFPLDYPNNFVDEIRASHILEHFSYGESINALKEWTRVLKPGGTLKIAVPDFAIIAEAFSNGMNDKRLMESYCMGGQTDEYDYHKSIWHMEKICNMLDVIGYENMERWTSEIKDCASLQISLNVKGTKK